VGLASDDSGVSDNRCVDVPDDVAVRLPVNRRIR
jgi:hypothetical protein